MRALRCFVRDNRAAGAAEFAMVLPAFLLFLLGAIDVGRYMWTLNSAEKATQMGARYAVVNNPVATVLSDDFNLDHGISGGDAVAEDDFGTATCTSTGAGSASCTVTGNLSSENGADAAAFTKIVNWMKTFYPTIDYPNVRIIYKNVGLGFAGDPNGPDVPALTIIEVTGVTFKPLILFGGSMQLPIIQAALTLEDAECAESDGNPNTEEETNCDWSN